MNPITTRTRPLDPERVLRQLNDAGVEYVLIGGFAVVIHGYERLTGDLDICYTRSRENVARLAAVLRHCTLVVHVVGLDDLIRLKHASGINAHLAQKDLHDAAALEENRDRTRSNEPDE
jgi:hypothetical protein